MEKKVGEGGCSSTHGEMGGGGPLSLGMEKDPAG